ncbi:MAG: co-chaperone GroES [Candidatus Magasanikbacteria bacterium RIFCSPLOWO2_01_FULL_43_20b]|uniref:Co-chaperonin GroES n=1 Tax=Candidatus Magasanikbacteria bacterium RIFCSPLOWO2_12_FULL_43_12 TaxID=1798692 RepID=A0A1F6MQS0_9BACT|nr:MAG: co-chaperone GroES [Candidatus Magasanikbacteria bacterium RIFCSPHIGHO2_02_FULL_44_13]OGH72732.1 MAG: co-chaperone GroES [Candidatus Magasanikbacteria bacterium RIFCSPLOWO2_02_FULL_43_22]OGH72945.1 MAG: co-chaperone GroES [Candidatus Magasanikbacteria bacterium RIFCSPLOWO2_01_FULL_43_20b]OGH74006.1 MAG: co-chaperone GroES [Candidatus Magasanikbacteria bacterium RIFCSPLOWO2_12_FULL_43_12]
MNIRPLGDRVLVKPIKEEEVTKSGIVLPDTVDKEKKMEGEVVAVGPGKMLDSGERAKMEVKVGDKVIFEKWGGEEVKVEKEEYKILSAEKILAIVE